MASRVDASEPRVLTSSEVIGAACNRACCLPLRRPVPVCSTGIWWSCVTGISRNAVLHAKMPSLV